jgi:hypothetical protein
VALHSQQHCLQAVLYVISPSHYRIISRGEISNAVIGLTIADRVLAELYFIINMVFSNTE